MNEPPPPYSVKHLLSGEWGVWDARYGAIVAVRKTEKEAQQVCLHRNAGYSEGWRDRDEANGETRSFEGFDWRPPPQRGRSDGEVHG